MHIRKGIVQSQEEEKESQNYIYGFNTPEFEFKTLDLTKKD